MEVDGVMLNATLNIISCGLIFSRVGLGVFLSNRVLRVIDLTCEASFALGGCIYGALLMGGAIHPSIALLIAAVLGYVAGLMTATLIPCVKQNFILASLLSVSVINSFLCKILHGESRSLAVKYSMCDTETANFISILIISGLCLFIFYRLLISEYGLAMRARGDGALISESLGINSTQVMKHGLGISNMICAFAGALLTQLSGRFSAEMGSGCLIFGIVAALLGERLFDTKGFRCAVTGVFIAAVIYQIVLKCLTLQDFYGLGEEYQGVILAATLVFLHEIKENVSNNNNDAVSIVT